MFLVKHRIVPVQHPSYSSEPVPCNCFFFSEIQFISSERFENGEDIKRHIDSAASHYTKRKFPEVLGPMEKLRGVFYRK